MPSPQEEFTHPVIQAMQQAFAQIQGAKNQQFQQALDTKKSDLEQAQFDEAKKLHETEKDFRQKSLEIALQELQNHMRKQHLDEAQQLQEYAAKGGKAQKADLNIPGMSNDLGQVGPDINIPGAGNSYLPGTDIQYDPANYQSQDEALQRQLDALRQSTTVKGQAEEPFKIADDTRRLEQAKQIDQDRFNRDLTVHNADRASAERVAKMKDNTDRYLGILSSQTRLALAKAGEDSNNPAIDNYVNDMYVAGNFDKIPGSTKVQNAIRGSVPKGWTPLNKEDKGKLIQ